MGAPSPPTRRAVVMPHGAPHVLVHDHPHAKDAWHQWEGVVVILVAVHIIALAIWCYLLYASKEGGAKRRGGRAGGGGGLFGGLFGGSFGRHKAEQPVTWEWRSPREILSAYNKARLGKA